MFGCSMDHGRKCSTGRSDVSEELQTKQSQLREEKEGQKAGRIRVEELTRDQKLSEDQGAEKSWGFVAGDVSEDLVLKNLNCIPADGLAGHHTRGLL